MPRGKPKAKPSRKSATRARVAMAVTPRSADIPENEHLWKSLRDGDRDLPPAERSRALSVVHRMIERDGLASRMTQQIDEWCVGDGASLVSNLKDDAKKEAHEAALASLWEEPQTDWPAFQHDLAKTLAPVGEVLTLLFAREDGMEAPTAYGFLDPECIDQVVLNPQNARQTVGVLRDTGPMRRSTFYPHHGFAAWARENPEAAKASGMGDLGKLRQGDAWRLPLDGTRTTAVTLGPPCAYFGWNRRVGATRGLSMFYAVADLIDALDQSIFQQVEGVAGRNSWVAHVIAKGSNDPQKIADIVAKQLGKGGGTVGTNEQVEVKMLAPDLGALDFDAHLTTMLKILSAETGWPVTWLGLGTEAGNAATTELAGPALKMMRNHQAAIRRAMKELLDYGMLRLAKGAGLTPEEALDYDIQLPEVGGRDLVRDAAAAVQLMVAVDTGTETQAWTPEKGGAMKRQIMGEVYGFEFDAEDIPEVEEPEDDPGVDPATPAMDPEDEDPDAADAGDDADDLARLRANGKKAQQSRRRLPQTRARV